MEKLAMGQQQKQEEGEQEREVSPWDCGSPLYDSFEVASLCHVLDRHLMFLPASGRSARLAGWPSDDAPPVPAGFLADSKAMLMPSSKQEEKKLRKMKQGNKHGYDHGNEKNMKARLRGICTAFTTLLEKIFI